YSGRLYIYDTPLSYTATLSLHDALPISHAGGLESQSRERRGRRSIESSTRHHGLSLPGRCSRRTLCRICQRGNARYRRRARLDRSEEHTSELQSQSNLVCRLLLEQKNEV